MTAPRRKVKSRRRRGAPRGNRNAVKSGIYVTGADSPEERRIARSITAAFKADMPTASTARAARLKRFVDDCLRLRRAIDQGHLVAAEKLNRTLRAHLRFLGAPEPAPTPRPRGPEDWARELLRVVERREREKAGR